MPTVLQLSIPASVVEALRVPEPHREAVLLRELALTLYAQGLLSLGKARELAAMDKLAFGTALAARGLARHYAAEDLTDDLAYARGA